jgi:hypothetical protein
MTCFPFRADMTPQVSKCDHDGGKNTLALVIKLDLPDRPNGRVLPSNRRDDPARTVMNVECANPIA